LIAGHLGVIALLYLDAGTYISITNGIEARVLPLREGWYSA
jgi:hypothetical protein